MAAKTGPSFSSPMSAEHRVKIQNSNILNALIEHAEGSRDMGATQVSAALGLLKKVLPDLSSVEMAANVNMTHEQWLDSLTDPAGEAQKTSE